MAHREFLKLFRLARAGDVVAQLLLGKIFLIGGYGQVPNPEIAFLWLSKAAQKDNLEAQVLIGSVFSPSFALPLSNNIFMRRCYQSAVEAGAEQAKAWLKELSVPNNKLRQLLPMYRVSVQCVYTQKSGKMRLNSLTC